MGFYGGLRGLWGPVGVYGVGGGQRGLLGSMRIQGGSMEVCRRAEGSMVVYGGGGGAWDVWGLEVYGSLWGAGRSMGVYGRSEGSMGFYGGLWGLWGAGRDGDIWGCMGLYAVVGDL